MELFQFRLSIKWGPWGSILESVLFLIYKNALGEKPACRQFSGEINMGEGGVQNSQ